MTDSQQCITLWGTPHSLYTGKIRSYLIKKGISFRERMPAEPAFQQRVVPVVGAVVVPILELADGTIVQDTSDMIDHLEQAFPARPMLPTSPVQRVTALLLDGFGSEACWPPPCTIAGPTAPSRNNSCAPNSAAACTPATTVMSVWLQARR